MLDKHSQSGVYGDHGKAENVSSDIPLAKNHVLYICMQMGQQAGLVEKYKSGA